MAYSLLLFVVVAVAFVGIAAAVVAVNNNLNMFDKPFKLCLSCCHKINTMLNRLIPL